MPGELRDACSLLAQSYGGACAAAELSDEDGNLVNGPACLAHLLRCSCLLSDPAPLTAKGQAQRAAALKHSEWLACSRMRENVDDMLRACVR